MSKERDELPHFSRWYIFVVPESVVIDSFNEFSLFCDKPFAEIMMTYFQLKNSNKTET